MMQFYGLLLICFVAANLMGMNLDLAIPKRMQMIPIFALLPTEINNALSFYLDLKGIINLCSTHIKAWERFKKALNESQKISKVKFN